MPLWANYYWLSVPCCNVCGKLKYARGIFVLCLEGIFSLDLSSMVKVKIVSDYNASPIYDLIGFLLGGPSVFAL